MLRTMRSSLMISIFALTACLENEPAADRSRPKPAPSNPAAATSSAAKTRPTSAPAPSATRVLGPSSDDANGSELLTNSPRPDTVRTIAHILEPKSRVGAYVGLPKGWRCDDPAALLLFPHGENKPPARATVMTLTTSGLSAENQKLLIESAGSTGLISPTWRPWRDQQVGRGRYAAAIAEGAGESMRQSEGPRHAIAAIIEIPGARPLGFLASWAVKSPDSRAAIVEMLRGVEKCQIEVGRGCVTDAERR